MDSQRRYANGMARTLLLLGLVAMVGCAPGIGSTRTPAISSRETPLIVDNQAWYDLRIYVLHGNRRIRVGNATGLSRTVLVIPRSMTGGAGELRLMADPIASLRVHTSEAIIAPETGSLHWRIQNGMRVSWLTIRN